MKLTKPDISRIIEMCWEDRTPFEAIMKNFKLSDKQIIQIMRKHLKRGSFILWRNRVRGMKTKYQKKNNLKFLRHQSYDHNKHR